MEICSAVAFLLEDLTEDSAFLDMECLLKILIEFYDAKDVKKEIEKDLSCLELPIEEIYSEMDIKGKQAFIIDLYEAREALCGYHYEEIMEKWLPKGEKRIEMERLLTEEGVEE